MIKKINQYFNKYFGLSWLFGYKNSKEKFTRIGFIVFFLVVVGLSRLVLEVLYGINLNDKWYSFDGDIMFVMSVFPFYLCFFLSMCTQLILDVFKIKADFRKVFWIFFVLQLSHMLIPFFDYLGFAFKITWTFQPYLNVGGCQLTPFSNVTNVIQALILLTPLVIFFTHPKLVTMGINVVWVSTGIIFARFLIKELKAGMSKTIPIILILFQIVYWPIYRYFFIFDRLFETIYLSLYKSEIIYYNHYGYGLYFLIFGLIGFFYFYSKLETKK